MSFAQVVSPFSLDFRSPVLMMLEKYEHDDCATIRSKSAALSVDQMYLF